MVFLKLISISTKPLDSFAVVGEHVELGVGLVEYLLVTRSVEAK
jgi:hypothetical protein